MNNLLQIGRNGGYPLCAENLSIIDENARMLNAVLSKLGLPAQSAILLKNNVMIPNSEVNSLFSYLFVSNGRCGELLHVGNDPNLLLGSTNPLKVTIRTENVNVTDENNEEYSDVYQLRYADISTPADSSEQWTIYQLEDVVASALHRTLPVQSVVGHEELQPYPIINQTPGAQVAGDESFGIKVYADKITLRITLQATNLQINEGTSYLHLSFPVYDLSGDFFFEANMWDEIYGGYSCDASLKKNGNAPMIELKIKQFAQKAGVQNMSFKGYIWLNAVFAL